MCCSLSRSWPVEAASAGLAARRWVVQVVLCWTCPRCLFQGANAFMRAAGIQHASSTAVGRGGKRTISSTSRRRATQPARISANIDAGEQIT